MLRFLGFMTGSALTAALALAIVDPVTLESLRRSAATLFLGVDPAAPAVTQLAQPAPDEAAELPPAVPTGSVRSRLLAALPGRPPTPTDAAVVRPATPIDASKAAKDPLDVAGEPVSDFGRSQPDVAEPGPPAVDRTAPTGGTAGREQFAEPGVASSAVDHPDAALVANTPRDLPAGDPPSWSDVVPGGAPPYESPRPDGRFDESSVTGTGGQEAGHVASAVARSGGFDSGTGESIAGPSGTSDSGTLDSGAFRAGTAGPAVAGEPAPTGDVPETRVATPAPAAAADQGGVSAVDVSGSDLEALPPPSEAAGAGGWHAFWTPFHSEASATGFARHLERATGEPYRVVRTGPGAYRVAFWHEGDDERSRRLLAIEQASGLSLRGGTL